MPKGLKGLVDRKTLAILTTILKNPEKIFHLNSLAEEAKIPVTSTARIINNLVKNDFAEIIIVGKTKLYKISKNEKTQKIGELL